MSFKAGVKRLGLFHLNQERTDQEVDEMVAACHRVIAERRVKMECFAVSSDMTFEV
jgi:phosphoribosyl 1,2-cyclic phosphodiesterase